MDLPLFGPAISLRDWQLADLPALAHWLRPDQRWQELDAPYYPGPSVADLPAVIEAKRREIEAGPPPIRRTAAIAERASETVLGSVSWYWQSEETHWLSVGIVLYDPARWGCGLGRQALGLWSEYLWAALPRLARLDLRTWSGNIGMQRLAEKLGYRLEARFRKARIVNGAYYDGLGYGVLREEWQARYPQGFAAAL